MTSFAAAQITKDRLRLWQKRNEREQHACTPMVLVNVSHDEEHSGQIILNTVQELSDEQVLGLLESAARAIREKINKGN